MAPILWRIKIMKNKKGSWIPFTPGGSCLAHLASKTKESAIKKLLKDACHMPYGTWENFKNRGYTVEFIEGYQ
jgi:hypothetical protein